MILKSVTEFESGLKRVHKKNGDMLLPSSIERYIQWTSHYEKKFQEFENVESLIAFFNEELKKRPSIVFYSAFVNYLKFQFGYQKLNPILMTVARPEKTASAMSSRRFLQSKVLSVGELRRLFLYTKDLKMQTIILWLYDTACRREEFMHITHTDVVLKDPLKDAKDISEGIYADIHVMGKGQKKRKVHLGKLSVQLYQELYKEKPEEKSFVFRFYIDGMERIPFQDQAHKLWQVIKKLGAECLDREIHPHCFRHTKLTHMADNGCDLMRIAAYAGHNDVKTSMIYIQNSSFLGRQAFSLYSKDFIEKP